MIPLEPTQFLHAGAALAAVLLLLWGGARLVERRGLSAKPGGRLGVRAVCALDPRRRLVLVHCDGREALLLTAPTGDQFLGWLPGPADAGPPSA
jgi:flagellar protein FliO/FliZ